MSTAADRLERLRADRRDALANMTTLILSGGCENITMALNLLKGALHSYKPLDVSMNFPGNLVMAKPTTSMLFDDCRVLNAMVREVNEYCTIIQCNAAACVLSYDYHRLGWGKPSLHYKWIPVTLLLDMEQYPSDWHDHIRTWLRADMYVGMGERRAIRERAKV